MVFFLVESQSLRFLKKLKNDRKNIYFYEKLDEYVLHLQIFSSFMKGFIILYFIHLNFFGWCCGIEITYVDCAETWHGGVGRVSQTIERSDNESN